ncbi:MAG: glycosyltransferase [Candidatus Coprenecus sp.]
MKIAFAHDVFPAGGAEMVTLKIADSLPDFDFFVLCNRFVEKNLVGTHPNITYLHTGPIGTYDRRDDIIRHIKEHQIDILIMISECVRGAELIKEQTECSMVVVCHGEPFWQKDYFAPRDKRRWWGRIIGSKGVDFIYENMGLAVKKAIGKTMKDLQICDKYICLCEEYCRIIRERIIDSTLAGKLGFIYNSQAVPEKINYEKERIVLFCGRIDNLSKRVDLLIDIWKKCQDRMEGWRLVIAGDGPDREAMERYAADSGLKNYEFKGHCNNTQALYDRASILALTSATEGWPLALTEAKANGVIPVAFDCSAGVRTILSSTIGDGFLIDCFDTQKFADTLTGISKMDGNRLADIRRALVEDIRKFSPESVALEWKSLFLFMKRR